MTRLNAAPVTVPIDDPRSDGDLDLVLNGDRFAEAVANLTWGPRVVLSICDMRGWEILAAEINALSIFLQFLNDPTTEPDASCLEQVPGVRFQVEG